MIISLSCTHIPIREQRRKDMTAYLGFKNIEGPSIQCGNVDDMHDDAKYWIKTIGGFTSSMGCLHR